MGKYNNTITFDLDSLIVEIKDLREGIKNYKGEGDLEYTKAKLKELEKYLIKLDPSTIWRIINFFEDCINGEINVMADTSVYPARIEALKHYLMALRNKPKTQPIEEFITHSYPDSIYPSQNKKSSISKDSTNQTYDVEELEKMSAEELNTILTNRINDNENKEKQLSNLERKYELIQKIVQEQKRGLDLDKQINEKTHNISGIFKGE